MRCRKRSRGAASPTALDPTAPATPLNLLSTNLQLTPPSSGNCRLRTGSIAVDDETVISPTDQQESLVPRSALEDGRRAAAPGHTDVLGNRRSLSSKYAKSLHASRSFDERLNLSYRSHVYLGYLRILYETICSCLRSINPNAFLLRHGLEVKGRLVSMAGNIVQDYKRWLWEFITQISNEESVQTELRLLKALQGIWDMNTIAGKEMFRDQKIDIYEHLISIYKAECNGPEVERYMILLGKLSTTESTLHEAGAGIDGQIADSMKRTSQELVNVSDQISRNLESPLLDSPWLYKTHTPFSPLHRSLRARLDKISEILAKEENGLDDCDFLKRKAVQVAAECGNARFLEEYLRDNPEQKTHADILNHTPVFVAAAHGNLEAFQTLVRRDNTLIAVRDRDGATLMDVLAAGGYTDLARDLLSLGFDVKQAPLADASPLHTAAERGHTEFCELLLEAGVDAKFVLVGPNGNGYTAALVAHHKSCEATDSKLKQKFYALALQIAEAEEPPQYSLKKIQSQPGQPEGSMTGYIPSTLRSLDPSPLPPENTLQPIGPSLFASSVSVNRISPERPFGSMHPSNDSALPPDMNSGLIGHNELDGSASTYSDSQYSFMSRSISEA